MSTTTATRDFGFLPIPTRLRYNPDKPAKFGFVLNAGFGLASTFVGTYPSFRFFHALTP
jgi:hypothetical protein